MRSERKVKFDDYLAAHPVFTVRELRSAYAGELTEGAAFQRLRSAVGSQRARSIVKGVYACIPKWANPATYEPDGFLVMVALRDDAVFCGHSALELLGAAHSVWQSVSALSNERHLHQRVGETVLRTFNPPALSNEELGLTKVTRLGTSLRTTGPERTLVEGFRYPERVGDLEEFVNSTYGLGLLDVDLLERVLSEFSQKRLYAAVGWLLARNLDLWGVDERFLVYLEGHIPKSPQYLDRRMGEATFVKRWNLIVPKRVQFEEAYSEY
jgi:hypothetical protein